MTPRRQLNRFAAWAKAGQERPRITRAELIRCAIDLLDKHGMDALTMRRLADRMNIKAASIYNHVDGREELLTLMADEICSELTQISLGTYWRAQLETLAIRFRQTLLSHRDGARVLAATAPVGPNRLRLIECVLGALIRARFPAGEAVDAAWVHNAYVVGFVLEENLGNPDGPVNGSRSREAEERWPKSLSNEQYPTLVSLAKELTNNKPDCRFEFGLRALLDGFELRLSKKKR